MLLDPRRTEPIVSAVTRHARLGLLLALAVTAPMSCAVAQKPTGRLSGTVLDKGRGVPLSGAVVVLLSDGRVFTTDSTGAFRFDKLPTGILRFLVRAPGFPSVGVIIALAPGENASRQVELDSTAAGALADSTIAAEAKAAAQSRGTAQPLPMIAVEATASLGPRFANFERRRKTGAGHYIVREEIEKSGYASLQDVARSVRGVNVECGGGLGCYIRMARAPMRCLPEYVVDDNVDNTFGPTIPVRDIEALEIYTGPSDVPGEYAGRNAGCGVIVIWTRSGPARRRRL